MHRPLLRIGSSRVEEELTQQGPQLPKFIQFTCVAGGIMSSRSFCMIAVLILLSRSLIFAPQMCFQSIGCEALMYRDQSVVPEARS